MSFVCTHVFIMLLFLWSMSLYIIVDKFRNFVGIGQWPQHVTTKRSHPATKFCVFTKVRSKSRRNKNVRSYNRAFYYLLKIISNLIESFLGQWFAVVVSCVMRHPAAKYKFTDVSEENIKSNFIRVCCLS
jgi:hypothetical protein